MFPANILMAATTCANWPMRNRIYSLCPPVAPVTIIRSVILVFGKTDTDSNMEMRQLPYGFPETLLYETAIFQKFQCREKPMIPAGGRPTSRFNAAGTG
jgi:hypothetical protein